MNERRLHNLKWTSDKKCLTSNDSRSDRNQSNEENKPTNEITKEVYHSLDTAESFSKRISSLSHSKNSRLLQKLKFLYSPPIIPILSHNNLVHTFNLSLFSVAKIQSTLSTCPYSESIKDNPHPLFWVTRTQSTPSICPYS